MSDLKKVQIAGYATLIFVTLFLYFRAGLPALIDLHDDLALLIAAVATFFVLAIAFLASRRLWTWANLNTQTKGE